MDDLGELRSPAVVDNSVCITYYKQLEWGKVNLGLKKKSVFQAAGRIYSFFLHLGSR